ncbi:hypothetical protein [Litoreibacter janthinus]|uniref:Uncharacterized protein n=1 Tax=Litoreibacter janthinus TaxID=670154 RepID=A0A1I6HPE8_9RHOB|nr:hypothetical protein [Litoreibacter janthinus]SFR56361.1 hypothetical protein SAMN04488002_3235 [Litoreibacter janthinus]
MADLVTSTAGLWFAVVLSGLYHGLNPGMGWPLAVSQALMESKPAALFRSLAALAVGHFAAMVLILLPFSALSSILTYERELRLGAGLLVIALGLYLLITRRHPRFLSRVPPHRLALWSFLVAIVHGAALMLVPIYLGLCGPEELEGGHLAVSELLLRNGGILIGVTVVHTGAMLIAGGGVAYAVYRWLGLKFLRQSWFDLEAIWALSLILVGVLGLATAGHA